MGGLKRRFVNWNFQKIGGSQAETHFGDRKRFLGKWWLLSIIVVENE